MNNEALGFYPCKLILKHQNFQDIKQNIKIEFNHTAYSAAYEFAKKVIINQTGFALNRTYPVEQQSPPTVHIKIIANACIKSNTNVKDIVLQIKMSSKVSLIYFCNVLFQMHR